MRQLGPERPAALLVPDHLVDAGSDHHLAPVGIDVQLQPFAGHLDRLGNKDLRDVVGLQADVPVVLLRVESPP